MTSSVVPWDRYDKKRLLALLICLITSVIGGCCADKISSDSWPAFLDAVFTAFPVFIGFLLTIMAISGGLDNFGILLSAGNLEIYKRSFESKLLRNVLLAMLYLLAIVLALFLKVLPAELPGFALIQGLFVGVSLFALFISLAIPYSLYGLYIERYALILKEKRANGQ